MLDYSASSLFPPPFPTSLRSYTQHTRAPANSTVTIGELERYWGLTDTKYYELRLWAPVLHVTY